MQPAKEITIQFVDEYPISAEETERRNAFTAVLGIQNVVQNIFGNLTQSEVANLSLSCKAFCNWKQEFFLFTPSLQSLHNRFYSATSISAEINIEEMTADALSESGSKGTFLLRCLVLNMTLEGMTVKKLPENFIATLLDTDFHSNRFSLLIRLLILCESTTAQTILEMQHNLAMNVVGDFKQFFKRLIEALAYCPNFWDRPCEEETHKQKVWALCVGHGQRQNWKKEVEALLASIETLDSPPEFFLSFPFSSLGESDFGAWKTYLFLAERNWKSFPLLNFLHHGNQLLSNDKSPKSANVESVYKVVVRHARLSMRTKEEIMRIGGEIVYFWKFLSTEHRRSLTNLLLNTSDCAMLWVYIQRMLKQFQAAFPEHPFSNELHKDFPEEDEIFCSFNRFIEQEMLSKIIQTDENFIQKIFDASIESRDDCLLGYVREIMEDCSGTLLQLPNGLLEELWEEDPHTNRFDLLAFLWIHCKKTTPQLIHQKIEEALSHKDESFGKELLGNALEELACDYNVWNRSPEGNKEALSFLVEKGNAFGLEELAENLRASYDEYLNKQENKDVNP